tara:strand:- start:213 stop:539 length:327 start_codon:yes stop_codon:yes gene_type:complete
MSIKNTEVRENKDTFEVYIELYEKNDRENIRKRKFVLADAIEILKSHKKSFGNCIQNPTLKNWNLSLLSGTWIFEKKSVDKPKKQVILKEEKPKTTQRRRTKKVSTEE